MKNFSILIVDDDESTAQSLSEFLRRRSYSVTAAGDGESGLAEMGRRQYDAVLLDIHLPRASGIDVLREIKEAAPDAAVIMMTAYASVDTAISALRLGATDYIIKPFDPDEIFNIVGRLVERKELIEANEEFSRVARSDYDFSNIITQDPRFLEVLDSIKRVAPADVPVVIMGESGSGKELVARALHTNSQRARKPLIAVNCAAISPTLMESEFFGHIKGSFTGAIADHKGYIERADQSTLLLDEIGELPLELQAKLLRVLQERQINRVGESRPIDIDVRFIAATQRNLKVEVEKGRFRKDLFFRLNLFSVTLPPLRERPCDVPPLVELFLARSSRRGMRVSEEAMDELIAYDWPGNVRELENIVERAAILAKDKLIMAGDLSLHPGGEEAGYMARVPPDEFDYKAAIKNVSDVAGRELIGRALARSGANVSKAARLLGVSRRFLTYRIKELGIRSVKQDREDES